MFDGYIRDHASWTPRAPAVIGPARAARRVPVSWAHIEAGNHANLCTRVAARHGLSISLTTVDAMQGFSLSVAAWSVGAAVGAGIYLEELPQVMEAHSDGVLGCTP